MRYLYLISGQTGSGVHETICLLRDVYHLRASPSLYAGQPAGQVEAAPDIWRINPTALAALCFFPPRQLPAYRLIYLHRPAFEREAALCNAGIPFPIALRHIANDLYAFRGWEERADLILECSTPQACAAHLYAYILHNEHRAETANEEARTPSASLG